MNLENLFKVDYWENDISIEGLSDELYTLYIYNSYIQNNKNILAIVNTTYEATSLYEKLLNYTSNVLFFPMDNFVTSEAIAISPELKTERLNTLLKLSSSSRRYIVVTNLMGYIRYLPSISTYLENVLTFKKNDNYHVEKILKALIDIGYSR